MYYARRVSPALRLTADDFLGYADEAVVLAVTTYNTPKSDLEGYVWRRVHSTLKNLIRQTAERLGLQAPNDTAESQMAEAGAEALQEHAVTVEDPGDEWHTPEQQAQQYEELAKNGATVQSLGAGGHAWHMRGETGFVLRAEYLRTTRALHEEVAQLQPDAATIFHLRFFQELPIQDVAVQAGVSLKTVSRVIARAIPVLRARLEARDIKDLSFLEGR